MIERWDVKLRSQITGSKIDTVAACNKAQMWRSSSRKMIILLYHFESSFCFTVFLPAVKYAISLLELNLSFTIFIGQCLEIIIKILFEFFRQKEQWFFRNYVSVSSCCKKGQKRFFGNLSGKKRGYLLRFHLNLQLDFPGLKMQFWPMRHF